MKLYQLMEVLNDGTTTFTILPYCEKYACGLESLKEESWYIEIQYYEVKRISTIGGGMYKAETCIELEKPEQGEVDQAKRKLEEQLYYEDVINEVVDKLKKMRRVLDMSVAFWGLDDVEKPEYCNLEALYLDLMIVWDCISDAERIIREGLPG